MTSKFPPWVLLVLSVLSCSLFTSSCSKKPAAPPPTQSSTTPEAKPPTAQPPPPAPAPAAPSFAGEWNGNSGPDLPLSFSVEGNQVTNLSTSYSGRNGTCTYSGSLSSEAPATIEGKTFTAKGKNDLQGHVEFTATGSFTSPTKASGTVVWKGTSGLCGDIALQNPFTAKKAAETLE